MNVRWKMQDRFKFRHWDKRINKIFYPERNDNFGYYAIIKKIVNTLYLLTNL